MNNASRTRIIQLRRNLNTSYQKIDELNTQIMKTQEELGEGGCCSALKRKSLLKKIINLERNADREQNHADQIVANWSQVTSNVWRLMYPNKPYNPLVFGNWWRNNMKKYSARTALRLQHPNLNMHTVRKLVVKSIKQQNN